MLGCIQNDSLRFNPHPHAEGDLGGATGVAPVFCFNPHPHAEGDYNRIGHVKMSACFNPHPHAEGDCSL